MNTIERLQRDGYRRVGTKERGFHWRAPGGRPAPRTEAERLHALRLPPAWTDVYAARDGGAKVQAIGKDKAGRWQYRYHPRFRAGKDASKYRRLLRFAEALPRLRRATDEHLKLPGLPREKVLACAVRILMTCFMRAGSEIYMRQNGSFGVATLRPRHVEVRGPVVRFDFPGKSGQRHVRELRDARVAKVVRELLAVPGRDLLKFEADDGYVDVRRRHINAYVKEIAGGGYTAKDFRTWAGTLVCACELARRAPGMVPGRTSAKRTISAAVKATAHVLGNTPAVCRSSYINPGVLSSFERGRVVQRYFHTIEELAQIGHGLHGAERALVTLLASSAPAPEAAPRRPSPRARGGDGSLVEQLRRSTRAVRREAAALRRASPQGRAAAAARR
jgi:DNA topoisomerase-1